MTCNHKIDIRTCLCAIAAALTLLTFPAAAQSPSPAQARRWCFANDDKVSDDQRMDGCTVVLKADPSNAAALANRGETYRRKGDSERAVADLNRALDLDPNDVIAWYNRGIAYDDLGDRDHAIADYTRAIQLEPDDARYYNNRETPASARTTTSVR